MKKVFIALCVLASTMMIASCSKTNAQKSTSANVEVAASDVSQKLAAMPQNVEIVFVTNEVDSFRLVKIGNDWLVKTWSDPDVSSRVTYTYFKIDRNGSILNFAEKKNNGKWSVSPVIDPETGKNYTMADAIEYSDFNELFSAWFDMDEDSGVHLNKDFRPNGEKVKICGIECIVYTNENDSHIFAVSEPTKLVFMIDLPASERINRPLEVINYNTKVTAFEIPLP